MEYWNKILQEYLHKGKTSYNFAYTCYNPERLPAGLKTNKRKPEKASIKRCYYLGAEYPEVYFTRREAECLVHLLKGKTINSTAISLGISRRTVEFYVKKMREKLKCNSKPELLEKVSETNFLKNLDFI